MLYCGVNKINKIFINNNFVCGLWSEWAADEWNSLLANWLTDWLSVRLADVGGRGGWLSEGYEMRWGDRSHFHIYMFISNTEMACTMMMIVNDHEDHTAWDTSVDSIYISGGDSAFSVTGEKRICIVLVSLPHLNRKRCFFYCYYFSIFNSFASSPLHVTTSSTATSSSLSFGSPPQPLA